MGLFGIGRSHPTPQTTQTTEAPLTVLTSDYTTDCAWCLADAGITPTDGSHGICTYHSDQIRLQQAVRRFERTPSYAERYRR